MTRNNQRAQAQSCADVSTGNEKTKRENIITVSVPVVEDCYPRRMSLALARGMPISASGMLCLCITPRKLAMQPS